jgi:ubiquitin fusion degradation protein 1
MLLPLQGICHGEVLVEYRRLEPGTFVRLTPQSQDFQRIVAEHCLDLEELLRGTLMQHTALTEGDWIEVDMPAELGGPQRLQVMELKPEASVSLLDTDLEADVTPSAEFMQRIEAEQAAARLAAEKAARVEAEEARLQAEAAAVCSSKKGLLSGSRDVECRINLGDDQIEQSARIKGLPTIKICCRLPVSPG